MSNFFGTIYFCPNKTVPGFESAGPVIKYSVNNLSLAELLSILRRHDDDGHRFIKYISSAENEVLLALYVQDGRVVGEFY